MNTLAIVLAEPQSLALQRLPLDAPRASDVVVAVDWSGISSGTERLLWTGDMPDFPGMGYPLVPGYETVGRVTAAGNESGRTVGETVFVAGAACFGPVRGLFGGAAAKLVVPGTRAVPIDATLGESAVLLALAATARHAMVGGALPDLIVGHGALGRLLARLAVAAGAKPTVWERDAARREPNTGYPVIDPAADPRRDYRAIYDVSGDSQALDQMIARLAPGGEIVLAGFYAKPLTFAFAPAFMREARLRVAAQWRPADLAFVTSAVAAGTLSLAGIVTHRALPTAAEPAYRTAFTDGRCLKMVLDWRHCQS